MVEICSRIGPLKTTPESLNFTPKDPIAPGGVESPWSVLEPAPESLRHGTACVPKSYIDTARASNTDVEATGLCETVVSTAPRPRDLKFLSKKPRSTATTPHNPGKRHALFTSPSQRTEMRKLEKCKTSRSHAGVEGGLCCAGTGEQT